MIAEESRNGSTSPGDKLNESHLACLLDQLNNYASRWKDFGLNLGFLSSELSGIEARPLLFLEAPKSWLRAMLESWLQWCPGDKRGSTGFATLSALKDAVSKAGLGRTASELKV